MATNGTNQPTQQAGQPPQTPAQGNPGTSNILNALTSALKTHMGEMGNDRLASLLLQNMPQLSELTKQGKVTQAQLMQILRDIADKNKSTTTSHAGTSQQSAATTTTATTATTPRPSVPPASTPTPVSIAPMLSAGAYSSSPTPTLASTTTSAYPISQTLSVTNPGPLPFPAAQGRPTLSGGIAGGRISGTPAQIARAQDDSSVLGSLDTSNRRKNTPNDQSMRRSIQDLVYSIDPNVKIEPEVEDLLLDIADEFIDSVTNFSCRLAKHRGGDSLEVRDLQLHLERNHNIRIPGFASDETRISISQSAVAPTTGTTTTGKKSAQNAQVTLRSQRLAQVAQAKKESKLM